MAMTGSLTGVAIAAASAMFAAFGGSNDDEEYEVNGDALKGLDSPGSKGDSSVVGPGSPAQGQGNPVAQGSQDQDPVSQGSQDQGNGEDDANDKPEEDGKSDDADGVPITGNSRDNGHLLAYIVAPLAFPNVSGTSSNTSQKNYIQTEIEFPPGLSLVTNITSSNEKTTIITSEIVFPSGLKLWKPTPKSGPPKVIARGGGMSLHTKTMQSLSSITRSVKKRFSKSSDRVRIHTTAVVGPYGLAAL